MKLKRLLVVAVAGAFALPLAAQASADSDRMILAQSSGTSAVGSGPTGGVPTTQSAGEPRAPNDPKAEQRRCESMTGAQRESCMRDASAGTSSGSSAGTTGSATGGASTAPAGQTGTTAGPGESSPKVGSGSDTATSSSSSGTGKAQ